MMNRLKFHEHILLEEFFITYILLSKNGIIINENIIDDIYIKLKDVSKKLGIKIKRTNSIFTYLGKMNSAIVELFRIFSLYLLTDIEDTETRKKLESDAKNYIKKANKKEIMDLILMIDKDLFSISSIPRHIFRSIFGIEITTYSTWKESKDYLLKTLEKVKELLIKIGLTKESDEYMFAEKLYISIKEK